MKSVYPIADDYNMLSPLANSDNPIIQEAYQRIIEKRGKVINIYKALDPEEY